MSVVSAAAGDVTRTWRVGPTKSTSVQLRHNTVTGAWFLSVDAIELTEGRATMLGGKALIGLPDKAGKGYIVVEPRMYQGQFVYSCWAGDPAAQIPEDSDAPPAHDSTGGFTIAVPGFDMVVEGGASGAGQPVVWYRIAVRRNADGASTVVHRRHREFYALGETVASHYKGTLLEGALPPLPSRTVPFMQNALDPAFLEGRRAELHNQLVKLEAVPRVRLNPDFLAFVGLLDGARESSVIFPPGAPMGLSLRNAGAFTDVETVKEGGPAAASGMVKPGSKVSKVQGEDVLGVPYDLLIAKLKACPRPMVVHFLSDITGGSGDGAGAAQPFAAFVAQPAGPAVVATPTSSVTVTAVPAQAAYQQAQAGPGATGAGDAAGAGGAVLFDVI